MNDDNCCFESLFRTLKYSPAYPAKPFESIDDARKWVLLFVTCYNRYHRHSGIHFVTPEQPRRGGDVSILAQRKADYEAAKARNPKRWTRFTRNWTHVSEVWLNPDRNPNSNPSIHVQDSLPRREG